MGISGFSVVFWVNSEPPGFVSKFGMLQNQPYSDNVYH